MSHIYQAYIRTAEFLNITFQKNAPSSMNKQCSSSFEVYLVLRNQTTFKS